MDKDFGSAMEFDGPLMTEKDLEKDHNDLIDDLLLSLGSSESKDEFTVLDGQPESPFNDILSIPSPIPMDQNSPTSDLPPQAKPQLTSTKTEPQECIEKKCFWWKISPFFLKQRTHLHM